MAQRPFNLPNWRTLWRDERFLQAAIQVIFVAGLAWAAWSLTQNMTAALQRQGVALGFDFLNGQAGFDIGEQLIPYTNADSFLRALQVGMLNTLMVCLVSVAFASGLGLLVGVARLSSNWLVNRLAWAFIEAMRNVPLLVLLVFLYQGVFIQLPRVRQAIELPGPIFLSNRGIALPWGEPTAALGAFGGAVMAFAGLAAAVWLGLRWREQRTGRPQPRGLAALAVWAGLTALAWLVWPEALLLRTEPARQGLNFQGGLTLSPEFMALFLGLTIYTAAFIGEVVRAGIQSVPKGQVEAARALGLNGAQTFNLVVFPQALKVIVPPLTSQYLNLAKNSTLAVAIGYPDLFSVSTTIVNQSGRAVEMFAIIMLTYLSLSLVTAVLMNWYNQRVKLVER